MMTGRQSWTDCVGGLLAISGSGWHADGGRWAPSGAAAQEGLRVRHLRDRPSCVPGVMSAHTLSG